MQGSDIRHFTQEDVDRVLGPPDHRVHVRQPPHVGQAAPVPDADAFPLAPSSDDDDDFVFVTPPPAKKKAAPPRQYVNERRRGAPLTDNTWSVGPASPPSPEVSKMTEISTGLEYRIPTCRVPKAQIALGMHDLCESFLPKNCTCTRRCTQAFTMEDIRNARHSVCRLPSERAVTDYLATLLRASGATWTINGRPVCRTWWCRYHAVSEAKTKCAMKMAKGGAGADQPGRARVPGSGRQKVQGVHAYTFWKGFFGALCQKPNDNIRLFPVAMTMEQIWATFFEPWWDHHKRPADEKPTFRTWQGERWHKDFSDVQRREKHFHCKCPTCDDLQARKALAFVGTCGDSVRLEADERRHSISTREWVLMEKALESESEQNPEKLALFSHDDTGAAGLPRFGNRTPKSLTKTRFWLVPWLVHDFSGHRMDYVFHPKTSLKKGANRMLTLMHTCLYRLKTDYTNPRHRVRRVVFIADNCSDNKNNTLLCYICHLVQLGWFDSIELLFGEVGHTHNGIDGTHYILNVEVGGLVSADFGSYVRNFPAAFHSDAKRPGASVLDVVYDWEAYYREWFRPMSGFTRTEHDHLVVRGFKASKNINGVVTLMWKVDPALDQEWRGVDGTFGSEGFVVMKGVPPADEGRVPVVQRHEGEQMPRNYLNTMLSTGMRSAMESRNLSDYVMPNYEACRDGKVPVNRVLEAKGPPGTWGKLVETGLPGATAQVRWIADDAFGAAPLVLPPGPNDEHLVATSSRYHISTDAAALQGRALPLLRFKGTVASKCAVFNHPNNIAHRESRKRKRPEPKKGRGGVDNDVSEESGDNVEGSIDEDENSDSGEWHKDGSTGQEWYQIPFAPKVGGFVLYNVEYDGCGGDEDVQPGVGLVKIKRIDDENQRAIGKPYCCIEPAWDAKCLTSAWNAANSNQDEVVESYTAIASFTKLNGAVRSKNKLPKVAVDAVRKHGLWT